MPVSAKNFPFMLNLLLHVVPSIIDYGGEEDDEPEEEKELSAAVPSAEPDNQDDECKPASNIVSCLSYFS